MLNTLATSTDSVDQLVNTLRVMCDRTRLRLLGALQSGEMNVTTLCEQLDLPQPTVSHHLGLLRQAGLVGNRRAGKQVFYCLCEDRVSNMVDHGGLKIKAGGIALQLLNEQQRAHPRPVEILAGPRPAEY